MSLVTLFSRRRPLPRARPTKAHLSVEYLEARLPPSDALLSGVLGGALWELSLSHLEPTLWESAAALTASPVVRHPGSWSEPVSDRLGSALALAGASLPLQNDQPPPPPLAGPSQQASGTFQVASAVPTSVQQVGENCLIELDAQFNFQGTLEGFFTAHFRIVHHAPCGQPGPETFQAQGTYQGTVAGAAGTFDFNFQGGIDAQGNAQGQLVIQQGTGGLTNLRGMLTLTGQAGVGGTYVGDIHFDP